MGPYRSTPPRTVYARSWARTRRALFLAIPPLVWIGLDELWPVLFYATGGCMSYELSAPGLLRWAGSGLLRYSALPVTITGLVLAVLVAVAGARRILARYRRPRGPIPGRRSRLAAMIVVAIALASLPVFAGALCTSDVQARGSAALAAGAAIVGGVLFVRAANARGYARWGLLFAAWTAAAIPRTVFATMRLRDVLDMLDRREHLSGASWMREWGAGANVAALASLVVLAVIAAWPPRRGHAPA